MPRTVEHIVECHQAATELRKAGKPIWNKTIEIRHIIAEDQANETPEHVAAISVRIAEQIRAKVPTSLFDVTHDEYDSDLDELIGNMESCTVESLSMDREVIGIEAVDLFNNWLEELYDWADKNRIWLG